MFWKRLFGGSKPAESIESQVAVDSWLSAEWGQYDYPIRHGLQAVRVWVDTSLYYDEERKGLDTCLRVLLPLDPVQLDERGLPNAGMVALVESTQRSLLQALAKAGQSGKVVGRIAYPPVLEIVLMLAVGSRPERAVTAWLQAQQDFPGAEAYLGQGWDFFEQHISPKAEDEHALASAKKFKALELSGTNKEARHHPTHRLEGKAEALNAAKAALEEAGYWEVEKGEDFLTMFKPVEFKQDAFVASQREALEVAMKHGCTYMGWDAPVIKAQVLSGNVKDGEGSYMYTKGAVYTGGWVGGQAHGKGKMVFENGDHYEGDWHQGKRTGQGVYRWSAKERYEGGFLESKLHGQGTYHYKNGNVYTGQWANDDRNGIGTLRFADGGSYQGEWAADKRHGQGRFIYTNPVEWYEGGFLANKIHGTGYDFVASTTRVRHGRWEDAKFIEELPLPEVSARWDWLPGPDKMEDLAAGMVEHAAVAMAQGRIPVVYFHAATEPASLNLLHYREFAPIADRLGRAAIMDVPVLPGAEAMRALGLPEGATLVRLTPDGKYAGRCVEGAVWHSDRLAQAQDKLGYLMMD